MKKKGKFVFVVYNKQRSDSGLNNFKNAIKHKMVLKEEPLPEELITRVENEEEIKLTPKVYAVAGLYEQYGNSALEHDKSIFIDADMPKQMRELAIYHELKEIAGKERGLNYNEAHMNARDGEIRYAEELGLHLEETPEEYRLDYAAHLSEMSWHKQLEYGYLLSEKQQDRLTEEFQELEVKKEALYERSKELLENLDLRSKPMRTRRELKHIRKKIQKIMDKERKLNAKLEKHDLEIEKEREKIEEVEGKKLEETIEGE